jgi:N-methylhydantoinase A
MPAAEARLAIDVGGTFTDVALELGTTLHTTKTLTTPAAPEQGVLAGIRKVLELASLEPGAVSSVIYGTTLATNLLIERKGTPTALLTTEGFRDTIEMRSENRYEQYDLNIDLPEPLVPRWLRFPVAERLNSRGEVLVPLAEDQVKAHAAQLKEAGVRSVAIGFLHSYMNPAHEEQARELLLERLQGLEVTLSSEVSPEMREFERISTACANAYVQPLMSRHLRALERRLTEAGLRCPLLMMLSGGGVTTVETAIRFPVRLVESGPAGGAIFAGHLARTLGLGNVLSFDMGGTTAKICLIDDGAPQTARSLEVARVYRFLKGSGIPLRIPVIELVEIGAGGGSIARIDALGRIAVGPESAGAEPGPACYARGGNDATVTDADLVLGRIDPETFAGGNMTLERNRAEAALTTAVGEPLGLGVSDAALGVAEMVDETMANAARVHTIERGEVVGERTLVAFGGAAPLHAARLAEKLEVDRVLVPPGAGVGSAIGFLRAPVAFEVSRSFHQRLGALEVERIDALLGAMRASAIRVVTAAGVRKHTETRTAFMRYVGQGHEVEVSVPERLGSDAEVVLKEAFESAYRRLYQRTIPGLEVEILNWTLKTGAEVAAIQAVAAAATVPAPAPTGSRELLDGATGERISAPIYARDDLPAGAEIEGPAVITERDTATVVSSRFRVSVHPQGSLVLNRKGST